MNNIRERLVHVDQHDFTRQTFRCGGKGGQNVNKVETGVRYIHRDSGSVGQATDHRTQGANDKLAWERCISHVKFTTWLRLESAKEARRLDGLKTLEEEVDESMNPANLKYEIKVNGRWTEISGTEFESLTAKVA